MEKKGWEMDTLDDEASRSDAIRVRLDELVDEASRQSFPASDPPAIHFDDGALVAPFTDGPTDRVEVGT